MRELILIYVILCVDSGLGRANLLSNESYRLFIGLRKYKRCQGVIKSLWIH
jgi:hypothetical protein